MIQSDQNRNLMTQQGEADEAAQRGRLQQVMWPCQWYFWRLYYILTCSFLGP